MKLLPNRNVQVLVDGAWIDANKNNTPGAIASEIREYIDDTGLTECGRYVASDGRTYRW